MAAIPRVDLRHFQEVYLERRETFSFRMYLGFKRLLDLIIFIIGIIIGMPIVSICGLLQKLESPGPIFFKQVRVRKGGKEIYYYTLFTGWAQVN